MTNIAEISVIATGSVALGTPLINAALAALQAKRAARSDRLGELRSVLDDAAVALIGFLETVGQLDTPTAPLALAELETQLPVMRAKLQNIWAQQARIAVRLGLGHPVYEAYTAAHDASGSYLMLFRDVVRARSGGKISLQEVAARQQLAYSTFIKLAAEVIGLDRG